MAPKTEQEFVDLHTDPIARRVAREVWRQMHPTGMHTSGPLRAVFEVYDIRRLLMKWEKSGGP